MMDDHTMSNYLLNIMSENKRYIMLLIYTGDEHFIRENIQWRKTKSKDEDSNGNNKFRENNNYSNISINTT